MSRIFQKWIPLFILLLTLTLRASAEDVGNASISGTVSASNGITPLSGILITAYSWDQSRNEWLPGKNTVSSDDGSYTIKGLIAGPYRVQFRDSAGDFITEFFGNTPNMEWATYVFVGISQTVSGIDASLEQAGKITGTITGPDGLTLHHGIHVDVHQWDSWGSNWQWINGSETGANGDYRVGGLTAGTYRVKFSDEDETYLTEYYHDSLTINGAQDIPVGAAATIHGINASLAEVGKISGTITAPDGATTLGGIQVMAYRWNEKWDEWLEYGDTSYSSSNGNYMISGLVAGNYRVRFRDNIGEYIGEYYGNASGIDSAADIPVGNPLSVTGINASLGKNTKITGIVTGPDGTTPLEGILVGAYYWNQEDEYWGYDEPVYTSKDGRYTIYGLSARTYRIGFYDLKGDHVSEYNDNVADVTDAVDLVLAQSATISGIDASLALASKITGTITGSDGVTQLAGIYVDAYQWNIHQNDWILVGGGISKSDGTYVTGGLATGAYRICISDPQGIHVAEYYNDVLDIGSATDITVGNAMTVSGINASLSEGAKITGRITTPSGDSSLEGIRIQAYYWNAAAGNWEEEKTTESGEDGSYTLRTIKPGIWRLGFSDYEGTYLTEYYNNTPDFPSATDIIIKGTQNITGINVSMNTEFLPIVKATLSGLRRTGPGAYAMDFKGEEGLFYQLQSSGTLDNWIDSGSPFMVGSAPITIEAGSSETKMFWRVRTIP